VLASVGRRHTAADVEEAFALARTMGFSCINMDFIAGLGSETPEQFFTSLERAIALDPENITVHTLTLKRASTLVEEGAAAAFYQKRADVTCMVDGARTRLRAAGYEPYYLYRQKNTVAALENTGYAKPGTECDYNVFIMDETQTILACGAGAVTKLRRPGGEKIERIYNLKYPAEYLERFDEIIERKEGIKKFYEACI
jgi:oxygen-independent coproporphyrinogen-3 oxidase